MNIDHCQLSWAEGDWRGRRSRKFCENRSGLGVESMRSMSLATAPGRTGR